MAGMFGAAANRLVLEVTHSKATIRPPLTLGVRERGEAAPWFTITTRPRLSLHSGIGVQGYDNPKA